MLDFKKLKILFLLLFVNRFFAQEILPIEIPLSGEASERNLEMSGLSWYRDYLILMPQYVNESSPAFYFLTRTTLNKWLNGNRNRPLTPQRIDIDMPDYGDLIEGYQGFEAICFSGKDVYLIVESKSNDKMKSYIVKGEIDIKNKSLEIGKDVLKEIPLPFNMKNMGYESILKYKNNLMILFEANGVNVNSNPKASLYNFSLKRKKSFSFPNIEYRITDVTEVDNQGKFWALNFFWPGEKKLLNPAPNTLLINLSKGSTHKQFEHIERLVEFKIEGNSIIRTNNAPIYLELNKNSRNWEGLVRMNKNGFLLIVDEHPRTILAYINQPKN